MQRSFRFEPARVSEQFDLTPAWARIGVFKLVLPLICIWLMAGVWRGSARSGGAQSPIPVLAYYYIWFDESSWERAKTDYPLLGRYSSDDRGVMQQHIRWAKEAGIDGFIVSWKSTERLNPRLAQLVELASQEGFKLAIIYQGLDFERDPLPVAKISADLAYFADRYGDEPVFDIFGKPLVIWSGTWKFTEDEVRTVSGANRGRLLILASERNLAGYQRLAGYVDGNAYYWSSVNPDTFPGYQEKLDGLSEAIHQRGGLWIAPAAPGFDARLIGGARVIERKDGETLLRQLQTALNSAPDAVGLISWNEFSENTHIEPSQNFGTRYLEVLAGYNQLSLPDFPVFDTSEPLEPLPAGEPPVREPVGALSSVFLVAAIFLLSLALIGVRTAARRQR